MDRERAVRAGMLKDPKTFREIVLADLYRGQRLVEKVHPYPIDPQFRMATPEGDWVIAITLPDGASQRAWRLALVSDFMTWKVAAAFTLVSELTTPDSVYAAGVSRTERHGCLSLITRKPALDFGSVEWMDARSIGVEIPALLPPLARKIGPERIRTLRQWFGASGHFAAVNIDTGEIGA